MLCVPSRAGMMDTEFKVNRLKYLHNATFRLGTCLVLSNIIFLDLVLLSRSREAIDC
jgi:hypothetical protein